MAAAQNHSEAQLYLGRCYATGTGRQPSRRDSMLTAAILSPQYFKFGSDATKRPEEMALADLSSPRRLYESCDSAYRLVTAAYRRRRAGQGDPGAVLAACG